MKLNKAEVANAKAELLARLKPGDTVYTRLNHVARSGMMRVIDLHIIRNNEPLRITWSVCAVTGTTYNMRHDGMQMDGAGMDVGFEAVYRLGKYLWPDGTPKPHGSCNGAPDLDGGYALRHRWL